LPTPRYAHVPLLLGKDGAKLSKRHGAPDVQTLREGGADPARVVAVLARSAGLVDAHVRRVRPRELVADFELSRVAAAENVLDPDALG
jgi:glutamyl-tRNA synthetase